MTDFGILPPAPSKPFVLTATEVSGGASMTFRPLSADWDGLVAASMREEAHDPEIDKATVTAEALKAKRAIRAKALGPRVASLTIAGVDRTDEAVAFVEALAAGRPDLFDRANLFAMRLESYEIQPPAEIDPEPIAGNL